MLKVDEHKRALDRLEELIDTDHLKSCDEIQYDAWMGKSPSRLPVSIYYPVGNDWPNYPFTQAFNDVEKNFMNSMVMPYCGALLKDDKTFTIGPEYGVVNIPELYGVPSIVTDQGCSMSKGLHDVDKIKAVIENGVPEIAGSHISKLNEYYDFATEVLSGYEKLSQVSHFIIPDNQGPFDLAHLVWGGEIMYAIFDYPDIVQQLVELMTDTYIAFTSYYKKRLGQAFNEGYHCCGVKLIKGGVRICDDSAVMCSRDCYLQFCKPHNTRAYAPYDGGWLHYCGNGNHFLDQLLTTPGVNALHMGNPDNCDLVELYNKTRETDTMLIWSGSLDRLHELRDMCGGHPAGLMILTENRYASKDPESAKANLELIRNYQPIAKAPY